MGLPPAVIIVVRHGARLDAADKQWHLTSPTPYDPPLTYGGWTQSRSLGQRIGNILRSRETDGELPTTTGESLGERDRRKRRYRVIIHTSPFLRCIQTSVGISAGLAQNPGHNTPLTSASPAIKPMHSSPRIRPITIAPSSLLPIHEPTTPRSNSRAQQQVKIRKSTLRVDAFLGEWLSPDYFELITPPPSSIMMVAGAKSDLLRREDYSNLVHVKESATNQPFPGGWGSSAAISEKEKEGEGLSCFSSLAAALPNRERTSSLSSAGSHGSRQNYRNAPNHQIQAPWCQIHGVYQPPIPSHAVSALEPIPSGYVAHARDACVDVDYQWDSMREPQNWGNGGEYGEEWSSMHKRFRAGLQNLVCWYQNNDDPGKLACNRARSKSLRAPIPEDDEDEETDLVIILVTHGAGCNALIGALTNQPVLLDVGMASLTMAVRKTPPLSIIDLSLIATAKSYSHSSRSLGLSDQYEVKLIANTEHLRSSASSTPSSSRAPSVAGFTNFRGRFETSGSFDQSFAKSRPIPSQNSNLGSIRRSTSAAGTVPRSYTPPQAHSFGLWSAPRPREEISAEDQADEDEMILNFGNDSALDANPKVEREMAGTSVEKEGKQSARESHSLEETPLGLWGTSRPLTLTEKLRESGMTKRRWTIDDRESMLGFNRHLDEKR